MQKLKVMPRMMRAKEVANAMGIGVSTWHRHVQTGRVKKPTKIGPRISVWSSDYVEELQQNGIPHLTDAAEVSGD